MHETMSKLSLLVTLALTRLTTPARAFGSAFHFNLLTGGSCRSNPSACRGPLNTYYVHWSRVHVQASARRRQSAMSGSVEGGSENGVYDDTLGGGEGGEQRPAATGGLLRALTGPQVSVAVGIGILLAVLANRIVTPDLVDSQARTDILGVIASGGLITNGVYLLDLNVKEAEEVTLVGTFAQEYADDLSPDARRSLQWLGESLLLVSPATSVLVYQNGQTLARIGVMGESPAIQDAPILRKCLRDGRDGQEQYLAALQTLPGKVEFDYLPENCQAVLMLPVLGASAVVVVGTNRARAFTPKDIAWMKGLCDQAALSLRQAAMA